MSSKDGFLESDDYNSDDEERSYVTSIYSETISVDGVAIKFDVSINNDEADVFDWLEKFDATARVDNKIVLHSHAKLINKARIRHNFWTCFEEPSQEMSDLGFGLFDRHGRLQRIYVDHEIKKGTGVWGVEIDDGNMFLIEIISVQQPWRRKGLATILVKKMMELAHTRASEWPYRHLFTFTSPGWLNYVVDKETPEGASEETKEEICHHHQTVAERFWRSVGFRRLGDSAWLVYADRPDHPSRDIASDRDYDRPDRPPREKLTEAWIHVYEGIQDQAINEDDCISRLKAALASNSATEHQQKPVVNEKGNTVLHMAVRNLRAVVTRHILTIMPSLANVRNADALTPLEYFRKRLDEKRTRLYHGLMTVDVSDSFNGFPTKAVQCLSLLTATECCDLTSLGQDKIQQAIAATDAQVLATPEFAIIRNTLQLRYGCSCGACVGGFLSPRMLYQLKNYGAFAYHLIQDMTEDTFWGGHMFQEHIPSPLFAQLVADNSMSSEFEKMLLRMIVCFEGGRIPNKSDIRPGMAFAQRDAMLEAAGNVLFQVTKSYDKLTGGEDGLLWNDLEDIDEQEEQLPTCRNDHEFALVSAMCGWKRVTTARF